MSRDYGEFGGALETPGGEINGNFCDIFEAGGKIYAVDSLSHLGLASTTVYSFDRGCKHHKVFSAENLDFKVRSSAKFTGLIHRLIPIICFSASTLIGV